MLLYNLITVSEVRSKWCDVLVDQSFTKAYCAGGTTVVFRRDDYNWALPKRDGSYGDDGEREKLTPRSV